MSAPANPFAFPSPDDGRPSDGYGMELRDWFAGQALNAVLHDPALTDEYCDKGPKVFAEVAYGIADAMLAARVTPTPVSTFSADADNGSTHA
jgi:hypothetical protein